MRHLDRLSDEALLAAVGLEERDAAVVFVRRFQRRVFGLAVTVTGDAALADDIAQITFERAWRHAATYDARRASVTTWLLTITRNLAIDAMRVRHSVPFDPDLLSELLPPSSSVDPQQAAEDADQLGRLGVELAELPIEQRRAVLLATLAGRTASEIAAIDGIPLGTAKDGSALASGGSVRPWRRWRDERTGAVGCAEFDLLADELALGQVGEPACGRLLAHAATCPDCHLLLEPRHRGRPSLARRARGGTARGIESRVVARLGTAVPTGRPILSNPWIAAAAVAAILVVGRGVALIGRSESVSPVAAAAIVTDEGAEVGAAELLAEPTLYLLITVDNPWPVPARVAVNSCGATARGHSSDNGTPLGSHPALGSGVDPEPLDAAAMRIISDGDVLATATFERRRSRRDQEPDDSACRRSRGPADSYLWQDEPTRERTIELDIIGGARRRQRDLRRVRERRRLVGLRDDRCRRGPEATTGHAAATTQRPAMLRQGRPATSSRPRSHRDGRQRRRAR